MLKLTMQCARCGKVSEREVHQIDKSVSRFMYKEGYRYLYVGGVNRLVCPACQEEFLEFQNKLEKEMEDKWCSFFESECELKEKDENGYKLGTKNE